ncbi:MAG: FmdB family zinc ribbon protein [Nocardioidaceae bacterium]
MPVYQYACTECGHQLEARQSFTDDPLTECPTCEGRLRKVLSAVGVVFKGSGFYRTDSRKDASGASTDGTSSGGKSDGISGKGSDSGSTSGGSEKKTPASTGVGSSTSSSFSAAT